MSRRRATLVRATLVRLAGLMAVGLIAVVALAGTRYPKPRNPYAVAATVVTPAPVTATAAGVANVPTVGKGPGSSPTTAPEPTTTTTVTAPAVSPVAVTVRPKPTPAAQALALITYPWQTLGYRITFHGPKTGYLGLTLCGARTVDIFVTPGQSVRQVAYIVAFELGHAIDCDGMAGPTHAKWAAARGFVAPTWYAPNFGNENGYPSGDFAEVFARWQVGPVYRWRSTLAPAPTAAQLAALVQLFSI